MIRLELARTKRPMAGGAHIDVAALCSLSSWWASSTLDARPEARDRRAVTWPVLLWLVYIQRVVGTCQVLYLDRNTIRANQSSRALINICKKQNWKIIQNKQKWITVIKCINTARAILLPLFIFKTQHMNSAWTPSNTPSNWHFSTNNSGWISNLHNYEWLITVFEPNTHPENHTQWCLFIMDNHNSHMTANFIAFYMKYLINLFILPPHTLHLLQPLDVNVFAPLKHTLTEETDAVFWLDSGRISRADWVSMFVWVRSQALISRNVFAGWKSVGLEPFQPQKMLRELSSQWTFIPSRLSTLPETSALDLLLLASSFPDGTELRNANHAFKFALQESTDLPSPARRYGERMTQAYEMAHSEMITMRKELKQQRELLEARKKRSKGKRIALQGKFVFTTEEVLQIAKEAESVSATKSAQKRPRKRPIQAVLDNEEEEMLDNNSNGSDSDCIIVATRR